MTDESPVRRSFRLKEKPACEYAYRNYLKKDYIPPAVIKTNQKYDDIFSSVVTNAFMMDIQKTPDEYYAEKESQRRLNEGSEESEISEDSEDIERDSDDVIEIEVLESRLNNIQKRIKEVKKLTAPPKKRAKYKRRKMTKDEKTVKQLEKIVEKIERGVKRIEKPLPAKHRFKSNSSSSSDIEILPTPVKKFDCSCGKAVEKHEDCHKHIFEEHNDHEVNADCKTCGFRLEEVRTKHGCPICYKFAINLEEHLIQHYRDSTAVNAVMECRFCTRHFKTVKEVMEHEQDKHISRPIRKVSMIHKCNECPYSFTSQETLVSHYSVHLDMNGLSDKINELQYNVNAEKEECPFCRLTTSSRKSFRAHLLKHHWNACKSLSKINMNETKTDEEIKKEIDELTRMSAIQERFEEAEAEIKEIKKEMKEEIDDDDYPIVLD